MSDNVTGTPAQEQMLGNIGTLETAAKQEAAPIEQEAEEVESTEESGDETGQEAEPEKDLKDLSKKEEKALVKQLKKFKLKVDGQEVEEELDLNDEEGLTKRFQLAKAAQKRMQEATELKKAAEQFIDMLKTNPRKVLTDPNIGIDLKKLAQDIINEEIENSSKSPEQIEKEKLQAELEAIKEKYKKEEDERKSKEFQRLQGEQEQKIQADIEGALKTSELPKTPYTVRKMAEMMMLALENDVDLSPRDLVPLLRKQMAVDIKELFSASNDDILEELVGKDNISRLRKRTVQKVKTQQVAQTANAVKQTASGTKAPAEKAAPKMSIKDFLRS